MRIEVIDEDSFLAALALLDDVGAVSLSTPNQYISVVTDMDLLASKLEANAGRGKIVVESK